MNTAELLQTTARIQRARDAMRALDQTGSLDEALRLLNNSEQKVAIAAVHAVLEQRISNAVEYIRIEINNGGLINETA